MEKSQKEKVIEHIWKMGEEYAKGWKEIVRKLGIKAELKGLSCMTSIVFDYEDKSFVKGLSTLYCQELAKRGIFAGAYFPVSFAHKKEEIDKILEAAEGALFIIKKAIAQGGVKGYLEAKESKPLFNKRMV